MEIDQDNLRAETASLSHELCSNYLYCFSSCSCEAGALNSRCGTGDVCCSVLSLSRQLPHVVVEAWCVVVAKVPLNGRCSPGDECSSALAQCVNGLCRCNDNYYDIQGVCGTYDMYHNNGNAGARLNL